MTARGRQPQWCVAEEAARILTQPVGALRESPAVSSRDACPPMTGPCLQDLRVSAHDCCASRSDPCTFPPYRFSDTQQHQAGPTIWGPRARGSAFHRGA